MPSSSAGCCCRVRRTTLRYLASVAAAQVAPAALSTKSVALAGTPSSATSRSPSSHITPPAPLLRLSLTILLARKVAQLPSASPCRSAGLAMKWLLDQNAMRAWYGNFAEAPAGGVGL